MMNRAVELSGYYLIERTLGDKYTFEQGNEYEFNSPGDKRFQFGADREIIICQDDVILDNSYVRTPASITANQTINRQLQGADVLYGSLVTLLTSTLKGYQSFASNTDLQKEDGTHVVVPSRGLSVAISTQMPAPLMKARRCCCQAH